MMNMGSSAHPDFSNTYNPASTHIDYYGLDPYPVRTGTTTIDYDMIDRAVAAAVASGIPASQVVPVYQTFGGGTWMTDTDGKYIMPTPSQEQTMMDHWAKLAPAPAFDYAYAWGSQQGDTALENDPELQAFFLQHNLNSTGTAPSGTTTPTSDGVFYGTSGADVIHGTTGADTMAGYGGNDTYYVDNAGDKVTEAVGGGTDKVLASVSYALSAGSEVELLATTDPSGTTAINLTGNEFAQYIAGNAGNNFIDGRGGADMLVGGAGNDQFYVDSAGDEVTEAAGEGYDVVRAAVSYSLAAGSEIEALTTTDHGGTGAINLTGNEFGQFIFGNAGNNNINGAGGNDTLDGGAGADAMLGGAGNDQLYVDSAGDTVRPRARATTWCGPR
jgi:serralysin